MEKNLISEISRINEMMGVKTPSLINESRCLFCEVMTRSLQNLQDLAKKGRIDPSTYNLRLNDLLKKVKGNPNLTPDQRSLLDSVISEFNTLTKTADDIAKQTENAKNVINKRASTLSKISDSVAEYAIDYVKLYESKVFIEDFFRFDPSTKPNIKKVEDVFSDPTKRSKRLDEFDTFDEYFDKSYKLSLSDALADEGYDESLISKIIEKYRESLKKNPKVGGAWEQTKKIGDVVPSKGDEMLSDVDPTIYKLYSEIIKKNGDQLTQIERNLLDDVQAWTKGDTVDFTTYKPKETINGGNTSSDNTKESTNFFEKYGQSIDFELLNAMNRLKEISDNNPNNEGLGEIIGLLKSNKKLTSEELQKFENDFKLLNNDDYANKLKNELLNPSGKKLNFLESFFWSSVEPLVKKWREVWVAGKLDKLAIDSGYNGGANFDYFANKFKKDLQNILLTMDSKSIKPADFASLQKLKDDFVRLKTPSVQSNVYYNKLWEDLDKYIENNLDESGKTQWVKLKTQMSEEKGSNWRYLTWREIVGDKTAIMAETAGSKENPEIRSFSMNLILSAIKRFTGPLASMYLTGNFRSPKQMMQFLVDNGYATKGVPIEYLNKVLPNFKLSAAGSNAVSNLLFKYFVVPVITAAGYTLLELKAEGLTGINLDERSGLSTFANAFINYFKGDDKEWNKYIRSEEGKKLLPKSIVSVLDYVGYYDYNDTESRQTDVYKTYKKFRSLTPEVADDIIGFYGENVFIDKKENTQVKTDAENLKKKSVIDANNKEVELVNKSRNEYNEKNKKLWNDLGKTFGAKGQTDIVDKYGWTELRNLLGDGRYGKLSYDDCKFIRDNMYTDPLITADIPPKDWPKPPTAIIILGGGGKYYKVVPVFSDNDPEGIYGKYPELNDKYAWIQPDVDSNMSNKTYHTLEEFVSKFKYGKK